MAIDHSEYNQMAFNRRKKVTFLGVACSISTIADLFILKLKWYNISPSEKQMEDLKFLILDKSIDEAYLNYWIPKLNLNTHGLLG